MAEEKVPSFAPAVAAVDVDQAGKKFFSGCFNYGRFSCDS